MELVKNRQKVLLKVIQGLQNKGISSRRAIVKALFLLKEEYFAGNSVKFYSFYPYKQGPFSQLCFSDLRKLNAEGMINDSENMLTDKGIKTANEMDILEADIHHLLGRFNNEKEMLDYVYSKYPSYTVKSQLVSHKKEQEIGFCTIGYEGKDIDSFLNVLIQNKISMVIDVRNNAFSMNFCFIGKKLKQYLNDAEIDYIHMPELGVESEDRANLNSKEDYEKLFLKYRQSLPLKQKYLDTIEKEGNNKRIALLCFEKDVSSCHRREIAKHIRNKGHEVLDL
ncbi:MAG TPA: DUF488 family protein [Nanoarchaeota archaeon]|nr:DUF488 family protein [Nanoarchaeota archaeon]